MHFYVVLSLIIVALAAPSLLACSVPQFSKEQSDVLSAEQLIDTYHFRKAIAELTAAPRESSSYWVLLSRAQLGLGDLNAALDSGEKALAVAPKNAAAHVQVAAVAGRMAERASMFKQISLAKRVKKELDEALTLEPKNADAIYGSILYCDLAPSFIGGDKARARLLADQLIAIAPARGYLAKATLAHNAKDLSTEEQMLKQAVAADPHSYDAHVALAVFQAKQDFAHAKQSAEQAAEQADEHACLALYLDPKRPEAWQVLAEQAAAEDLREVDGLLTVYRQFEPDDLSPAYHAAVGLIATGKNLDAAQGLLKRYLEVPPDGNSPSVGQAHYQLALVAEKQGHPDQAIELLRTATREDPTLEDARKELKKLEHPPHVDR